MRLVLKYATRAPSGAWHYRRRVPKAIAEVVGKREFKGKLGDTEKQALLAWPRFHAAVEKQIDEAMSAPSVGAASPSTTERAAYAEALRQYRALLAHAPMDVEALHGDMADSLLSAYPEDRETGDPVGVPPVQRHLVNLLRNTEVETKAPAVTLEDAKREYIKERWNGGTAPEDKTAVASVERAIRLVITALGRNPTITGITRDDAKEARDFMLARTKVNGETVSAATVERELNNVRAVISFAIVDSLVPRNTANYFEKLPMPSALRTGGDATKRDPFPKAVLIAVRRRVLDRANPELAHIWRILEGTGCRLAEVSGLRTADVVLAGPLGETFPHIKVTWHQDRRLKTKASIRHVPLAGDALVAAREAVGSTKGEMLFPLYGRTRGADAASKALMKHVRGVTANPKHVVHSLRHNMKDRLMLAQIPDHVQNLILGHSLNGVGNRTYGGDAAKLEETSRAMLKVADGLPKMG